MLAPPSEEALPFNQASMRALLELAPDAIFVADIEGRYTYVNTAGLRMLGYTRSEIIGRTIFDFIRSEDADRLLRFDVDGRIGNRPRRTAEGRRLEIAHIALEPLQARLNVVRLCKCGHGRRGEGEHGRNRASHHPMDAS